MTQTMQHEEHGAVTAQPMAYYPNDEVRTRLTSAVSGADISELIDVTNMSEDDFHHLLLSK